MSSKLMELSIEWINQNSGVFSFGYTCEEDKNYLISFLTELSKGLSRRVIPSTQNNNHVIKDKDVTILRALKLKNSIFIVELENLINISNYDSHQRSVLYSFLESSQINNNVIILIQKVWKSSIPTYSSVSIQMSNVFFRVSDGVMDIIKCRYSDYQLSEDIRLYLRDIKLEALIS